MNYGILILSVLVAFSVSTVYGEEDNVEIVLLYPNGDRATINEIILTIDSLDGTIHKELTGDNSQSFQTILDFGRDYKITVYMHDMLVSTKIVSSDMLKNMITVNIPSTGGVKFLVYYNDGTPIEDATVKLYSYKKNLIRTGTTDSLGQTLRFWISTTPSENNFYVPIVSLGNNINFTHNTLNLTPGSTDVKVITPWPSSVDYLDVTTQLDSTHGMHSWNDDFSASLTSDKFSKTVSFNRGKAHFTTLPVGTFDLTVYERDRPNLVWANQTINLSKKTNDLVVTVKDPYPTSPATYLSQTNDTTVYAQSEPKFLNDLNFLKQSLGGTQIVATDADTTFLKLVTDGDNLPVFTRSSKIKENLLNSDFSAKIFVDKPENVDELWFTFTSDDFSSGWYIYSVPPESISDGWSKISFSANDLKLTGTQDLASIDRMQIRIRDNSQPVSFGISSISFEHNDMHTLSETCNCVAFRLDDVQDFFLADVQMTLMQTFQKNDVDLTIGVIANNIGRDNDLTNFVSSVSDVPEIELANHGWDHEDFAQFETMGQEMLLLKSNNRIDELFGVRPTVFIPPFNSYNDGTIAALTSLGFTHFSSELDFATPPFPLSGQTLYHFPETAFTGKLNEDRTRFVGLDASSTFEQVEKSITEYGFAVVTLHPQEFSLFYHENYQDEVDYSQIQQLEALFEHLREHNINTVLISEINTEPNQKVIVPQWVKNNAKWWVENRVSTEEFVDSLEFLISEEIIHVSPTEQTTKLMHMPDWVKQSIGWWANGRTSDSEFLSATQFLIQNGIIQI